jgi:hypothetical protein
MRGWRWIGGALIVLVGVTLTAAVVGAPRGTISSDERPTEGARAAARVRHSASASRVAWAVRARDRESHGEVAPLAARRRRHGDDPLVDGVAREIDRQQSAMRAALLLLVAGDATQARIR